MQVYNTHKKGVSKVKILDHNGAEKFESQEVQFDENFTFNEAEKEVALNTTKLLQTTTKMSLVYNDICPLSFSNINTNHVKTTGAFNIGNCLLPEDKTHIRIFTFDLFPSIKWKNGISSFNDYPNHITFNIYLKLNGASFNSNSQNDKILISKISANEADLMNISANKFYYYNTRVLLLKEPAIVGTSTHKISVPVNTFDFKGNIIESSDVQKYIYQNNSTVRKQIDGSMTFELVTEVEINYDGKATPTNWNFFSGLKNYKIEIIK